MTTWHPDTPAWYTDAAEAVCTPRQLEVLILASHDDEGDAWIATFLGITRQAVNDTRRRAHRRIQHALKGAA